MSDDLVDLGVVTAPSGALVLAMVGYVDYVWSEAGQRLSDHAKAAAVAGGGHIREWHFEAVAVPVSAGQVLPIRAATTLSPFDQEPTIAVLEVDLGLANPLAEGGTFLLGDLPVDRCGMLLGDAVALDSWIGPGGQSRDGLADVAYWGAHAEAVWAEFGGDPIGRWPGQFGWMDLPIVQARQLVESLRAWTGDSKGRGVMVSLDMHTDYYLASRIGWDHPLHVGAIRVGGCRVLLIEWDPGDHSMRHRGERAYGQVYPVTVSRDATRGPVMRWTIPPENPE